MKIVEFRPKKNKNVALGAAERVAVWLLWIAVFAWIGWRYTPYGG